MARVCVQAQQLGWNLLGILIVLFVFFTASFFLPGGFVSKGDRLCALVELVVTLILDMRGLFVMILSCCTLVVGP